MEIDVPIHVVSVMNMREHWAAKARRAKQQRTATHWACKQLEKPNLPVTVTLIRIGKRLLDSDNLASGFKACRDGIADWLGIDDADPRVIWMYAQEKGEPGVRVKFDSTIRIEEYA